MCVINAVSLCKNKFLIVFLATISASRTKVSGTPKPVMSRVPTPPPPGEMSSGPVAESWCYTQVLTLLIKSCSTKKSDNTDHVLDGLLDFKSYHTARR